MDSTTSAAHRRVGAAAVRARPRDHDGERGFRGGGGFGGGGQTAPAPSTGGTTT
jgi:hypothetical protein